MGIPAQTQPPRALPPAPRERWSWGCAAVPRAPLGAGPAESSLLATGSSGRLRVCRSIPRPSARTPHAPTPPPTPPPQGLSCSDSICGTEEDKEAWAFFLTSTLGGRELFFYAAHCSLTAIRKNHPVHGLYWICKLLILFFNNHLLSTINHERWEEVRRCISAIKLLPGSTSAEQRILLYVGIDLPPLLIWLGASRDHVWWNPKTIWKQRWM